ncbi:3',5'-cyclic-nucleotide phosphodiesterase [Mesorhizobium sp. LHD-90]|uniref:3',5'-cyclic-nucleotide phosphodiesterase n=1 Tax=Mesorhizobium sp. LHD-90 TaxID=3071414 RepID=UPI0027DF3ABE|nr:3',5'-cyclic-nucleotide phosphodiesterase [Mesorhizobium sp. LHD-90]MDQ6436174.1 3',5'-cyclic-nucleotide phosphodiesterase [Mesorhizobium sp. LHD-90]
MKRTILFALAACFALPTLSRAGEGFDVVTLGARGGIEDGNLSAYLISPHGDPRGVTCDAGALVAGLRVAEAKGAFDTVTVPADSPYTRVGYMLTDRIRGYLISHAHLDHIAGLIAASPDDAKKPIYALPSVNSDIEQTYFNWEAWPNFGNRGKEPLLKKYEYRDLPASGKVELTGTGMSVTAFPLSHGGVESTAFLVENGKDALLCFGDTGPDEVEKATRIADIWTAVADKVRARQLKAIIIEVSYTNAQPDKFLFGHLTPAWLLKSLHGLEEKAGKGSLKDLPVVISHIKYSLKKGPLPQEDILKELQAGNDLGVNFIIPEQGMKWRF